MFRNLVLVLSVFGLWVCSTVAHSVPLAGSEWSPSPDSKQFIQFQSDGKVTGFAGCNRFFGSYEILNETLKFGVFGATKMMCTAAAMELEQRLFENLSKVAQFERDQQRLTLFDKDRGVILELIQRDWD